MDGIAQAALFTAIGSVIVALISLAGAIYVNAEITKLKTTVKQAFDYIDYLLNGIDKLTDQIINDFKGKPIWKPERKRPKED